jgi:hypothetical protein
MSLHMLNWVPLPEMDSQLETEQRRSPRIYCRVPVQLRASDGRDFTAMCIDVSANGIGVQSNLLLGVGLRLHLVVPKPNGDISLVPMLVIYRMENHYGLSALGAYKDVLDLIPMQA